MPKHNTYEQDENISDNDIVLGSDTDGNRVFEERYDAQNSRKPAKKVIVKK